MIQYGGVVVNGALCVVVPSKLWQVLFLLEGVPDVGSIATRE